MTERLKWTPRRLPSTAQLRAYVDIVLGNMEKHAADQAAVAGAKGMIQQALDEFVRGERDKVSLFLTVKGIEYQVAGSLGFDSRELRWLVTNDLRQTPATDKEVTELCDCFFGKDCEQSQPVDSGKLAKLTHVAIGYWSRYATMLVEASRREKYIALALGICLLGYFSRMLMAGLHSTILSPSEGFFQWYEGSDAFTFFFLGCAGAVVSLVLSGSKFAVSANRPLDGLYAFWSTIPRLLVGGIAGMLAVRVTSVIAPVLNLPAGDEREPMLEVLKIFLAFSGGFADRLFFKKLVDTTWRVSGLTSSDQQQPAGGA